MVYWDQHSTSQKSTTRSARGAFLPFLCSPAPVPYTAQPLLGAPGAEGRAGASRVWLPWEAVAGWCYVLATGASGEDSTGPGAGSEEAGSPDGPAAVPCSAARRFSRAGTSPT